MNCDMYEEILDLVLERFNNEPRPAPPWDELVGTLDVEMLAFQVRLSEAGIKKIPANSDNVEYLRGLMVRALKVLWACCARTTWKDIDSLIVADCQELFDRAVAKARALSTYKNHDYSPYNIWKAENVGLATRNGDKISRISNFLLKPNHQLAVKDENIVETAADMVNYAIYHEMVARGGWVNQEEREEFRAYLDRFGGKELSGYFSDTGPEGVLYVRRLPWKPPTP